MKFERGDHVCVIYSSARELVMTVCDFLVNGLAKRERCWYVAAAREDRAIRAALCAAGVDVAAEIARGALRLIPARHAYLIHGEFDPEGTVRIFNDAIEEALAAGAEFRGPVK